MLLSIENLSNITFSAIKFKIRNMDTIFIHKFHECFYNLLSVNCRIDCSYFFNTKDNKGFHKGH